MDGIERCHITMQNATINDINNNRTGKITIINIDCYNAIPQCINFPSSML